LYERALAVQEREYGHDDPGVATLLHNLALVNGTLGDFADAHQQHDRAVAIQTVCSSDQELADMLVLRGGHWKPSPVSFRLDIRRTRVWGESRKSLVPCSATQARAIDRIAKLNDFSEGIGDMVRR
jgi:hypothetical protein